MPLTQNIGFTPTGSRVYAIGTMGGSQVPSALTKTGAFKIAFSGQYFCRLSLLSGSPSNASARIYKNGSPFGTLRQNSNTTTFYDEVLAFSAGDTMELWIGSSDGVNPASSFVYVSSGTPIPNLNLDATLQP